MSVKSQALLKDLVVQRLVVAADEIFALFERTFAEYQDEILKSRQQARGVTHKEEIFPESTKIKVEEDSTFESEENITKSSAQRDPEEENTRDSAAEPCAEEPGCSVDFHFSNHDKHNSCSDTDNSSEWELTDKKPTKHKKQRPQKSLPLKSTDPPALISLKEDVPEVFSCSHCGMKFAYRYTLARHVRRIHNQERPHTCSVCQRSFFRRYDYLNHMMIHTGEQPYRCSDCGHNFRYKKRLKYHICSGKQSLEEKHTEENEDSAERQMLAADFQTVTVEPTKVKLEEDSSLEIPLPCVKAEEGTESAEENRQEFGSEQREEAEPGCSGNLDNDQVHSGSDSENPSDEDLTDERSTEGKGEEKKADPGEEESCEKKHGCSVCEMKFRHRSTLLRHVRRVHNNERNYSCLFCQKSFFRRHEFKSHMVSHTGEQPFTCTLCGKSYRHKKSLYDHSCLQRQDIS